MKTLLLIDANSLIHRAFHALPPLTTPDGKPIQAIYGLSSIFLRLWREEKPDYAAALFDRPEPTFRKEKYKEYKAQRPKAPDELISQIIEAHNFFNEFGIKTYEKPGYEADDLIATLAEKFRGWGDVRVVILTGDLDTLQLVEDEKVLVRTFKKGISDTFIYNEKAVHDRYGLRPDQLVDYKALVGDASDNIKGVPGVGPKTASDLLKKFGTLDEVYKNLASDPNIQKKLAGSEEQAEFSKSLVILERRVPIEASDLRELEVRENQENLTSYFKKMGFESLIKRMNGVTAAPVAKEPPKPSEKESSQASIFSAVQKQPSAKTKIQKDAMFLAGSVNGIPETELASPKLKVGFDLKALLKGLWEKKSDLAPPYFDLGVAFWLLDPDFKKYDPQSSFKKFLGREWTGGAEDAESAFAFAEAKLKEHKLEEVFHEIEMPALGILAGMEREGIFLEPARLKELETKIEARLADLTREIYREAGREFNVNSPKQLGEVLFKKLSHRNGEKVGKTPGGQPSTSAENLEALQEKIPLAKLALEYREAFKIQSTYVKPFQELVSPDGRIHTEFIQTGTATGRLSSQNPNLQNVPRESVWADEFRSAFVAPDGFSFVAFDYSQIELRILAALSEDPNMIAAFKRGLDIHQATAARIFDVPLENVRPEMRRLAKTLNFGLIYGMGVSAFAKTSGVGREQALKFVNAYFEEFSKIKLWQEKVRRDARTLGYVQTPTGRRRYLLGIASGVPRVVAEAERAAMNQPIQGLAADIIKLAMIETESALEAKHWRGKEVKMILSIHDELLFEVRDSMIKEAIPVIREAMERVYELAVPLKTEVSVGKDWGRLAKFNNG